MQNLSISAPSKIFLSSHAFSIPQKHPRHSQDSSTRSSRWLKIAKYGLKIAGSTRAQRGPISPRDVGNVRDPHKRLSRFQDGLKWLQDRPRWLPDEPTWSHKPQNASFGISKIVLSPRRRANFTELAHLCPVQDFPVLSCLFDPSKSPKMVTR